MLLRTAPGPTPVAAALGAGEKMVASSAPAEVATGGGGRGSDGVGGGVEVSLALGEMKTVRSGSSGLSASLMLRPYAGLRASRVVSSQATTITLTLSGAPRSR